MWFVVLLVRMHCLGKKDAYAEDQSSMHWAGQLKLSDYTTRVNLVPLDRTEGFNIGHGHLPLLISDAKFMAITGVQSATTTKRVTPGLADAHLNGNSSNFDCLR